MPKKITDETQGTTPATTPANNNDIFDHGGTVEPGDDNAIAAAHRINGDPIENVLADDQSQQHGIDFDALAARTIAMREAGELPTQGFAGSTHGAGTTGEGVDDFEGMDGDGGAFFLDLAKAEEVLELMAVGTRAVVSCKGAEAKMSGTGNPMIVLRVKIERVLSAPASVAADKLATYRNRTIRDNLLFIPPNEITGSRGTLWRAKQAFDAFGIEWPAQSYRSASAFMEMLAVKADAFVGTVAEIEIGIEKANPKNINTETGRPYDDRNVVTRYKKYEPAVSVPTIDNGGDDLPF